MKVDWTINMSSILTVIVMIFGGVGAWYGVVGRVQALETANGYEQSDIKILEEKVESVKEGQASTNERLGRIETEQSHAKEDRQEIKDDVKDVLRLLRQRNQ